MISFTVATEPSGRRRTKLGVGEGVLLSIEPKPTEEVTWTLSGGGSLESRTGPTNRFTADERATRPTVTATVGGAVLAPFTYEVIEPTGEKGVLTAKIAFKAGTAGAGMCLRTELIPSDVSFSNLEVREVSGEATNVTGYFSVRPKKELAHKASDWLPVSPINATNDRAELSINLPPPWAKGSFEFDIPVQWRVKGSTRAVDLPHVVQKFSMNGAGGKVTITKLEQQITRWPWDTSGTVKQEDPCPEKTLAQHSTPSG